MVTLDEMEKMLDEIAEEFPKELYNDLNGGILLLPEAKHSPAGPNLYILGEYNRGGNMGRYITIYYGSFMRLFGGYTHQHIKERLEMTLKHEFIHHVESLAGEKDLEKKDAESIAQYLRIMRDR